MAWPPKLSPAHVETLKYFDRYDYPLTKDELEFWSGAKVRWLPKRPKLEKIRRLREKYSLLKWGIAYIQAARLAKLPFVVAIFVTGSLAMSNCQKSDDIDLMIITYPNTLWIARLIVNLLFVNQRRFPNLKSAPDKICLNLWLDIKNLKFKIKNLYVAHEILQAKCIFDRGGIQYQFLKQNSWVRDFLPNAYKQSFENLKITRLHSAEAESFCGQENYKLIKNYKLKIINYILYWAQWLYMKPKMTTERVGPGFAFFHPKVKNN